MADVIFVDATDSIADADGRVMTFASITYLFQLSGDERKEVKNNT